MRTRLLSLPSARVFVTETGPPDARALLCVHGLLRTSYSFRHLHAAPGLRDIRVISMDLPGAGDSDRPRPADAGEYRLEFLAESVSQVTHALGLTHVSLLGHDLGGSVALQAAAGPLATRVDKLVLISPACFPFELPLVGRLALVPVVGELTFGAFRRRDLERILRRGFVEQQALEEGVVDIYWDRLGRAGGLVAAHAMLANFERLHRLVHEFARVQAETLVVWGDGDAVIDPSHGVALVAELARARLATVEGAGHAPHEERPDAVIDLIAAFLGG